MASARSVDHKVPVSPSMGVSRQEDWGGLPCPLPGDRPDTGIKPLSLASPNADSLPLITWEASYHISGHWITEAISGLRTEKRPQSQ